MIVREQQMIREKNVTICCCDRFASLQRDI